MNSNSCRCRDLREGAGAGLVRSLTLGRGGKCSLTVTVETPFSYSSSLLPPRQGIGENPACPGAHSPGRAAWTTCPFLHSPKSTDTRKPQKRSTKCKLTPQTLQGACRHFLSNRGAMPGADFGAGGSEDWDCLPYVGEGASWLQRLQDAVVVRPKNIDHTNG